MAQTCEQRAYENEQQRFCEALERLNASPVGKVFLLTVDAMSHQACFSAGGSGGQTVVDLVDELMDAMADFRNHCNEAF
jgi:hypothetical protein